MSTSPAPIPFTPSDASIPSILRALASPFHTLAEIALAAHTTLEALSLWMTTPAIREQLESTDAIAAWRTGYAARLTLNKAIASLDDVLSENLSQRRACIAQSLAASSTPVQSLRTQVIEIRHIESVRRCASLMLRLSRLPAPPPIPTSPPTRQTHPANISAAPSPSIAVPPPPSPADPAAQGPTDFRAPSPTHSPQTPTEPPPETHPDEPPRAQDGPPHARDERVPERIPRIHTQHDPASDITPVSELLNPPEVTSDAPASEHWP